MCILSLVHFASVRLLKNSGLHPLVLSRLALASSSQVLVELSVAPSASLKPANVGRPK